MSGSDRKATKVTVDDGTKSRILANAILKQAGIAERI